MDWIALISAVSVVFGQQRHQRMPASYARTIAAGSQNKHLSQSCRGSQRYRQALNLCQVFE